MMLVAVNCTRGETGAPHGYVGSNPTLPKLKLSNYQIYECTKQFRN